MVYPQFTSDNDFATTVFTYIDIVETPLLAALAPSGGSKIILGNDEIATLDGNLYSKDPDVDPAVDQVN
jgi:hypothetical protein